MRIAATLLLLALLGWLLPRVLVDDGVDRFAEDPAAFAFAREALEGAWQVQDHPVARLLTRAARVVEVRYDPGHCRPGEPGGRARYAAYRGIVRFYTVFALPAGTVYVTCGGWQWSRQPPG